MTITVSEECGCVLAEKTDCVEECHRWWFEVVNKPPQHQSDDDGVKRFDITDAGRLVFISEVIHFADTDEIGVNGRHYVAESDAAVPPAVADELNDNGFETILNTDGEVITT